MKTAGLKGKGAGVMWGQMWGFSRQTTRCVAFLNDSTPYDSRRSFRTCTGICLVRSKGEAQSDLVTSGTRMIDSVGSLLDGAMTLDSKPAACFRCFDLAAVKCEMTQLW